MERTACTQIVVKERVSRDLALVKLLTSSGLRAGLTPGG